MAVILFLPFVTPKIFLVILVLLVGLALIDRRLIVLLSTRYVNKKSVSKFILPKVLILFFHRFLPLKILCINLLGISGWL